MSKFITKRQKALVKLTEKGKSYPLKEAIAVLKTAPTTKFDPSVELQFKLGVDLAASDQGGRGTAMLPHGRGKKLRVIVFSKDESAKAAREAGADFVGGDDLIEKVLGGWMDFDVAIATPSLMKDIAKLRKRAPGRTIPQERSRKSTAAALSLRWINLATSTSRLESFLFPMKNFVKT